MASGNQQPSCIRGNGAGEAGGTAGGTCREACMLGQRPLGRGVVWGAPRGPGEALGRQQDAGGGAGGHASTRPRGGPRPRARAGAATPARPAFRGMCRSTPVSPLGGGAGGGLHHSEPQSSSWGRTTFPGQSFDDGAGVRFEGRNRSGLGAPVPAEHGAEGGLRASRARRQGPRVAPTQGARGSWEKLGFQR